MLISKRQLMITVILTLVILVLTIPISNIFDIKLKWLVREPAALLKVNPFTGYLSNLGMLLWSATISICLFSAVVLRKNLQKKFFWFLISSSFLTLMLLMDDMFMFHESLAPEYLGIGEKVVYGFYLLFASAYFIFFRKEILCTKFFALFLACVFMGLSVLMDYFQDPYLWPLGQWEYLLEEGCKWIGIGWWCSYFMQTSVQYFKKYLSPSVVITQIPSTASKVY